MNALIATLCLFITYFSIQLLIKKLLVIGFPLPKHRHLFVRKHNMNLTLAALAISSAVQIAVYANLEGV